jgi:hypothetical protein
MSRPGRWGGEGGAGRRNGCAAMVASNVAYDVMQAKHGPRFFLESSPAPRRVAAACRMRRSAAALAPRATSSWLTGAAGRRPRTFKHVSSGCVPPKVQSSPSPCTRTAWTRRSSACRPSAPSRRTLCWTTCSPTCRCRLVPHFPSGPVQPQRAPRLPERSAFHPPPFAPS